MFGGQGHCMAATSLRRSNGVDARNSASVVQCWWSRTAFLSRLPGGSQVADGPRALVTSVIEIAPSSSLSKLQTIAPQHRGSRAREEETNSKSVYSEISIVFARLQCEDLETMLVYLAVGGKGTGNNSDIR